MKDTPVTTGPLTKFTLSPLNRLPTPSVFSIFDITTRGIVLPSCVVCIRRRSTSSGYEITWPQMPAKPP
eukprot:CAMPEP_0206130138 /NCGR_PEP_ID=MMETSP1472-20131121/39472_1 /ASSEMBLY_ACC=CAM_ASM_001108 /TAXON_ID=41880 /ORGANISM="Pycnococcus provasolii, Strain RCC251" /LENGTH=68 /DNA_ID=CAMNT_0053521459 /DNA_START=31 /DNA_END=237 /DNA_ORIENTATION=+